MFYIHLLGIAALSLSANAFPGIINSNVASSPLKNDLIIARDLDDSFLISEGPTPVLDSTLPSDFQTDIAAEGTPSQDNDNLTPEDASSSNSFTVALQKDSQKLYCPYDDSVDGYAVYFVQFWSSARNMKDWHQGILLSEIGKKHEFLYDVTGELDVEPLQKRVRDPFFVSQYPFTETRLEGLITPKIRLAEFNNIVADTPAPQCRDDGNCQTWVQKVLDAAIPSVIYPLTTYPKSRP